MQLQDLDKGKMKKLMNMVQAHEEEKSSQRYSHVNVKQSEEEPEREDVFEDDFLRLRFEKRFGILPSDPQVSNLYKKYEFMEQQFKNRNYDYRSYFRQKRENLKKLAKQDTEFFHEIQEEESDEVFRQLDKAIFHVNDDSNSEC